MTVIDGQNCYLGRLASVVAKRLLQGEQIDLVNAEKVFISGNADQIREKYKVRHSLQHHGNPKGGPKFYKMPYRIVKTAVSGMLPTKTTRGKLALKKFKAYIGVPKEFEASKKHVILEAQKPTSKKHMTVEQVSKFLGAKW